MKNRFNNLTSKEWLPFQKSWFKYTDDETLYKQNIRFFIKFDDAEKEPNLLFWGSAKKLKTIQKLEKELSFNLFTPDTVSKKDVLQFVLIDFRDFLHEDSSFNNYLKLKKQVLDFIFTLKNNLAHRKFISIHTPNLYHNNKFYPVAWDLAKTISSFYSLKDEKIGCFEQENKNERIDFFKTSENHFYSLYFRNDEKSQYQISNHTFPFFEHNTQINNKKEFNIFPSWYILKPKPRKKNEILHPAKYPEDLAEMHIKAFTKGDENVFDPMSGTGTTQLAAMMLNRNGYGTELSDFFCDIANERCKHFKTENANTAEYKILCKDARKIKPKDFPSIDYIITSPPYWDMLNMKGAENQAKRIKKGLQVNYSDNKEDLGNMSDYHDFLNDLTKIYYNLINLLKPGGYMTIVVKNIKKKGSNYPFAWDLSLKLQEKMILLPETFWLQDDISIAPYGYGNTFVSNTFHQYCLTFQKPL
ncbi:MAG: site-specific DNA-methyltransferase [Bacteroidales bacterium]